VFGEEGGDCFLSSLECRDAKIESYLILNRREKASLLAGLPWEFRRPSMKVISL